jgi:8-oxo-dGTP pyrophosphatase MutT (NUDIX family)
VTAPSDVPLRDAATVMLVRDGDGGVEVFMLRRTPSAAFAGGAHVFPGGAVDDADRHGDLEAVCEGRTDAEASRLLGIDAGGLAFWVAALRESFEEAGLLLAYDSTGELLGFDDDADLATRFAAHRGAVDRGERRLVDVCVTEGLRLAVDCVHYVSHWVTPRGQTRRFDTRFFVAAAPSAQAGFHDDREAVDSLWVHPADALARARDGEIELIIPTIHNLEALAAFARCDDLLEAAAAAAVGGPPQFAPQPEWLRELG